MKLSLINVFVSFNLTTGERSSIQNFGRGSGINSLRYNIRFTWRISVNSDASTLYVCRKNILGFALEKSGNTYRLTGNGRTNAVKSYKAVNNGDVDTELAPVLG